MSKLTRRKVGSAKVESTYNSDASPSVSTDAFLMEDFNWQLEGLRMVERPAIRNSIGALQHVYGGALLGCSFLCEVKGSGSAGTAPEIGQLLRGCALDETIVASTSVTYAPISDSPESLTIDLYEDGTRIKLTGCRGNADFVGEVGGRLMVSFSFQGHFAGPADVAFPTPSYDSTVPPILIGANFSIGGYGAIIQALNVSLGNSIEVPPNMNAADGYAEVLVTGRDVNGSYNPQQTLVATKDFMAALKAGTLEAIDTGVLGATAGNRFQLQLPKTYPRNLSPGDREGVQVYDIPFGAAENSGDDELSLAFT